jgi:hypothetical protein
MGDVFKFQSNRESSVEDEVMAWAENNGWLPRFMSYRGRNGCPDVWFIGFGEVVIMEFKKPRDGKLSEVQKRERQRFLDRGVVVHVVDNALIGISILRGKML